MLRIMMHPVSGQGPQPPDPTQPPSQDPTEQADSPIAEHGDSVTPKPGQTSQQIAGYMGPERGPFECEHCIHFGEPNSCDIVSGHIEPEVCCNLFEPDPNRRPKGDDDEDEDDQQEAPEEPGGADVTSLLQGH